MLTSIGAIVLGSTLMNPGLTASEQTNRRIEIRYVIEASETPIGTVSIQRTRIGVDPDEILSETRLVLDIEAGDDGYKLSSSSTARFSMTSLVNFDHRINDNERRFHVAGERVDNGMWVSAQRVRTPAEQEDKSITDAALQMAAAAIPYLDVAAWLLGSEDEISRSIPAGDFDLTEAEIPQFVAAGESGAFRILNTEELEIVDAELRQEGVATIEVDGRQVVSRMASVVGKKRSERYWIASDSLGPYIVKLEGQDKDGPYSITLSQYLFVP